MTKFYFEIKGWHGLAAEDEAVYAEYTDEQKHEGIERAKMVLRELMVDELIGSDAPYDLDVKYIEMEDK